MIVSFLKQNPTQSDVITKIIHPKVDHSGEFWIFRNASVSKCFWIGNDWRHWSTQD
jgi:hypothetical protein